MRNDWGCINIDFVRKQADYMTEFHTRDETLKYEKQHHTMDKSTLKQQFCILDSSRLHCVKNLNPYT